MHGLNPSFLLLVKEFNDFPGFALYKGNMQGVGRLAGYDNVLRRHVLEPGVNRHFEPGEFDQF
ncbi:hypothetical protein, partial [Dialister succinatiphilus]|uniref:hypothetical protein n=1 Tax=Dialister succinatiphilus TaxID=487173 RepID=UPI003F7D7CD4